MQVLQAIAAGMPEMTNTMMAAILQILLCLSLDITASNLAGILCMNKDVSLPLEEAELLSLAQLVWSRSGDSQCSALAVKVRLSLLACWTWLCNLHCSCSDHQHASQTLLHAVSMQGHTLSLRRVLLTSQSDRLPMLAGGATM